jgi:hypothetical protein
MMVAQASLPAHRCRHCAFTSGPVHVPRGVPLQIEKYRDHAQREAWLQSAAGGRGRPSHFLIFLNEMMVAQASLPAHLS